ncbi:MAG: hypothetical protein GY856_12780 [bacterium]|nr:hypothetical protein [bacterium]
MTKKPRRLILGLAAATLVLLPQFGQAQTPVELVPFEGLKYQLLISLPEGWFATNTGSATDQGVRHLGSVFLSPVDLEPPEEMTRLKASLKEALEEWVATINPPTDQGALQLGMVFFSPIDLGRLELIAQLKAIPKILTGETPSFILYREREPKGTKCEGFSEKGKEKVIQIIDDHSILGDDSEVLEPLRTEQIFAGGCRALRLRGRSRGADGAEWVTDVHAIARFGVLYLFALRNKKEYYAANLETYDKVMRTLELTVRSATEGYSPRPLSYLGPESYWRYAEIFHGIETKFGRMTLAATPNLSQPISPTEAETPAAFVVFDELEKQFTIALPDGWRVYKFLGKESGSVIFTAQEIAKPGEVPEAEMALKLDRGSVPSIIVELFPAGKNMSCRDLTKKGAARAANFVEGSPGFSGEVHYPWRPKKKPILQIGGCQGYNIHFKAWLGEPTSGTEWIVDVRAVSDGKTLYLISHRSTPAYYKRNLERFEEVLATFRLSSPQ